MSTNSCVRHCLTEIAVRSGRYHHSMDFSYPDIDIPISLIPQLFAHYQIHLTQIPLGFLPIGTEPCIAIISTANQGRHALVYNTDLDMFYCPQTQSTWPHQDALSNLIIWWQARPSASLSDTYASITQEFPHV